MTLSLAARRLANSRHLAAMTAAASAVATVAVTYAADPDDLDNGHNNQETPQHGWLKRQQESLAPVSTHCSAAVPTNHPPKPHALAHSNALIGDPTPSPSPKSSAAAARFKLRRHHTLRRMNQASTKVSLASKYQLEREPIGEGAFGEVFLAKDRATGEQVAVKKIWKQYSNNQDFLREMMALLQIRSHGGHPHICSLRENFDEAEHFALVLDLIKGGEMFDYLVTNGAYSELDASRLIQEIASALDFLHGIGLVHCDLKPENLMLSSKDDSASIKVVDFGCSETLPGFQAAADVKHSFLPAVEQNKKSGSTTIAYCPPEALEDLDAPVQPALDMWSLGIILHIMLTGIHPFDSSGDTSDEVLGKRICRERRPNLRSSPNTQHLSSSAIDLLSKLLEPDPKKRLKAHEMLQHSWVRGETARSDIMQGSDRRLGKFRKYRSRIETKVFQELIQWSDNINRQDPSQSGESLVKKAFSSLDKENKGFLTVDDITADVIDDEVDPEAASSMTLSAFSDLLGVNMVNKYFPRGHAIFQEGDIGEHMYFLNSGTVEVSTEDGFHAILSHGDTFGEGGLLSSDRKRSATIRTRTPVHAIQIDKDCFQKYLLGSDSALALKIKERVNKRRFGRAQFIIAHQDNLQTARVPQGSTIFSQGDDPNDVFVLVEGKVDVGIGGKTIYHIEPGKLFGVQSYYLNRPRGATAACVSDECTIKIMSGDDFKKLAKSMPELEESLHELCLRREFRRAIVHKMDASFHQLDMRDIFEAVDLDDSGRISVDELRDLLTHLDVSIPEKGLRRLVESLDLENTGQINFEEFTSIFG